ncbi:hypothetical protein HA402_002131 [Bradysia odoriphaga]|nr:hypothetical protein HA402_002131 [Bradysia odoriphaga]
MNAATLKKLMTKKLVEFCATDMRPFEIIQGEGFRQLAQFIWSMGSLHGNQFTDVTCILPHPTTISRNVTAIKEDTMKRVMPAIKNSMEDGECSASTDMWTDSHRKNHFLTMTAHYFDHNFTMKRKVLFTSLFKAKSKTGANIKRELTKRFKSMGLDAKLLRKIPFVTDQGSNIVKALKPPFKRRNCRAHLLNTILRNTFESDDIPLIIQKTLMNCKKIVRHLKQSGKSNELSKAVVQDCGTRWNYRLDMLQSVVQLHSEIMPLLSKKRREDWSVDIELANEIITFLKPFKEACKSMEGDSYCTSNKILLWWAELSEHLNEEICTRPSMKIVFRIARKFFKKKYSINMDNKVDCFLDPRYRELKMLSDVERNEVFAEVKRLMNKAGNSTSENESSLANKSKFFRFEGSLDDEKLDEFQLYMNTARFSMYLDDANDKKHLVEMFWRDNKNAFPQLFNLAKQRLHIPASSGSSERVFSDAGRTSGAGSSGANMSMFYCEVIEVDKVNSGGGVDDEMIDVIEMSMDEVNEIVKQGAKNVSPPACLLGILWFLHNKCPK